MVAWESVGRISQYAVRKRADLVPEGPTKVVRSQVREGAVCIVWMMNQKAVSSEVLQEGGVQV